MLYPACFKERIGRRIGIKAAFYPGGQQSRYALMLQRASNVIQSG